MMLTRTLALVILIVSVQGMQRKESCATITYEVEYGCRQCRLDKSNNLYIWENDIVKKALWNGGRNPMSIYDIEQEGRTPTTEFLCRMMCKFLLTEDEKYGSTPTSHPSPPPSFDTSSIEQPPLPTPSFTDQPSVAEDPMDHQDSRMDTSDAFFDSESCSRGSSTEQKRLNEDKINEILRIVRETNEILKKITSN